MEQTKSPQLMFEINAGLDNLPLDFKSGLISSFKMGDNLITMNLTNLDDGNCFFSSNIYLDPDLPESQQATIIESLDTIGKETEPYSQISPYDNCGSICFDPTRKQLQITTNLYFISDCLSGVLKVLNDLEQVVGLLPNNIYDPYPPIISVHVPRAFDLSQTAEIQDYILPSNN